MALNRRVLAFNTCDNNCQWHFTSFIYRTSYWKTHNKGLSKDIGLENTTEGKERNAKNELSQAAVGMVELFSFHNR